MTKQPISPQAACRTLLEELRYPILYWSDQQQSPADLCDGMAFSLMNFLDGTTSSDLPPLQLVLRPDPAVQAQRQAAGQAYFQTGMILNHENDELHDLWYHPPAVPEKWTGQRRPRPLPKNAVLRQFLDALKTQVTYWSEQDITPRERCEGVVRSLLQLIDGTSTSGLPPFDLVLRGASRMKSRTGGYYVGGMVINADCMLHELFEEITREPPASAGP